MLAEALIVIPVVALFAIGILEFGNVLWQRHQLQTGVRDAARYWSRCRPGFGSCSLDTARNIAFTGIPTTGGTLRIPNWDEASELEIEPVTPPTVPLATDLVTVTGSVDYQGSPLFNLLMDETFTIQYAHQERYIGW